MDQNLTFQSYPVKEGAATTQIHTRICMQTVSFTCSLAKLYIPSSSKLEPPKNVEMIPAVVIEIEDPQTFRKDYYAVERYIGETESMGRGECV